MRSRLSEEDVRFDVVQTNEGARHRIRRALELETIFDEIGMAGLAAIGCFHNGIK
jgi:hypothetical protein